MEFLILKQNQHTNKLIHLDLPDRFFIRPKGRLYYIMDLPVLLHGLRLHQSRRPFFE